MTETASTLPKWDLSVVYPSLESDEFERGFEAFKSDVADLKDKFDRHEIDLAKGLTVDDSLISTFEDILSNFNQVMEKAETLEAFIFSYVSTDSTDDLAQAKLSEMEQVGVQLSMMATRLTAWLGSMDVEALIDASETAAAHAFALRKAKREAEHLMAPEKEVLAAKLSLTGSTAWSRLHGDISSQINVKLEIEGEEKTLPMSAVRNLAYEADRATREAGYQAELETWESWQVPLAAAMNGIKGEVNTLNEERGWESALDRSLFQNNMDRQSFQAMMTAAREAFPDFRRYLKAKARALGLERLAFYDIFAPLESGGQEWRYSDATEFILEHFGGYSEKMRNLAARAFDENWIDAEPRPGKRDGAFCMWLMPEQSRILSNYQPSYDGMSTLAHELGHAYHNLNLSERTAVQRETPMTLAETASTFCQTIIQKKALEVADEPGQIYILENALQDSCQVVVDITCRLQFEQEVFERRHDRPLSAEEFNQLMLEAQADTYGDGLDPDLRHPYMWAVKPHYYSGGRSFYNYPYMFGLLFGYGLYARYQEDPEGFRQGYDDLLSSTGMDDAASLAKRFGIDIQTPDFWRSSLDVIREDIDRFEALVAA
ncbi:MAG: M3 family oligoendopeptidase [Anaerolineales bacterium]